MKRPKRKVSIIMPVYNSKEYLDKAIKSVMKQSYKDFELILVDDGSTDGSGSLCNRYIRKHDNIVVIHKNNEGLSAARNSGLKMANGKYIAFIDNDDLYLPNLLEDNIKIMEKNNADLVRFNRIRETSFKNGKVVIDEGGTTGIAGKKEVVVYEEDEIHNSYNKIRSSGALFCVWNGIYRRDIIIKNEIFFDQEIRFGFEDWVFNLEYLKHVRRMVFNGKSYYRYFRRANHSVLTQFNENRVLGIIKSYEREIEVLKEFGAYDKQQKLTSFYNYVMDVFELLDSKKCRLNLYKKAKCLQEIRTKAVFQQEFSDEELEQLKEYGKVNSYLVTQFYLGNMYRLVSVRKAYNIVSRKQTI